MISRIKEWRERNFILSDMVFGVIICLSILLVYLYACRVEVAACLDGSRSTIYSTMASVIGSLIGFVITAFSIVMVVVAEKKMKILRDNKDYDKLWLSYFISILILFVSLVISLVALTVDKDAVGSNTIWTTSGKVLFFSALFSWVLSFVFLARIVILLKFLITLHSSIDEDDEGDGLLD